jgi:Na+-translocating ferredoxin:NAD+ oxidoreductase RnfG subunit
VRARFIAPTAIVVFASPAFAERWMTVEQAQAALFPGETLTRVPLTLTAEQAKAIAKASGIRVRNKDLAVWKASSGGFFIVDLVLGKHEDITWALAITQDGAVKGLEILEYRESYGHEIRDPGWRAQFTGKKTEAPLTLDKDIQNISGATLSCRHISDGVRRLLATWAEVLHAL